MDGRQTISYLVESESQTHKISFSLSCTTFGPHFHLNKAFSLWSLSVSGPSVFHFVCFSFFPFVLFLNLATRPRASQPSIPYKAAKRNLQTFRYGHCHPLLNTMKSLLTQGSSLSFSHDTQELSQPSSSSHSVTPNPRYAPNIPDALDSSQRASLLWHTDSVTLPEEFKVIQPATTTTDTQQKTYRPKD